MKKIVVAFVLGLVTASSALAVDIQLGENETKILYKKDLEEGLFLRLDSLVMAKGSKLIIGEPIDVINIHIKMLDASENTLIDLSGRKQGNDGAVGNDNNQQASYCHAGPSGSPGGNGGAGQVGVNAAMLVDVKRIEGLTINLSGTRGGNGGAGGRGGRGGGGKAWPNFCSEGDGGWGGQGGSGGPGGNASELHFRWRNNDPSVCWGSASDRPPKLTIVQNIGPGGSGGAGGVGGPGRHTGSTGAKGSNGAPGSVGYLKVERIPSVDDAGICKK